MKLTISKPALLSAVSAVLGVVKQKSTLPALNHVLLKAEGDTVIITASNLDASIQSKAPAKISAGGEVCLPARRFADAVKYAAGDEIALTLDDKNTATLKAGTSTFKIRGMAADEFPPVKFGQCGKQILIPAAKLSEMIRSVQYAQCKDASRYVLRGVLFQIEADKVKLVATDSRRLALNELAIAIDPSNCGEFILPLDSVPEFARIAGDCSGDLYLSFNDASAELSDGNATFSTKLIEGSFPNYKQVIPKEEKASALIDREQLIAALECAAVMTTEKSVSVRCDFGGKGVTISSNSPEVGEANESIDSKYTGPDVAIAINPDFLREFAVAVDAKEIKVSLIDSLSPMVLRAGNALGVIMCMRLS